MGLPFNSTYLSPVVCSAASATQVQAWDSWGASYQGLQLEWVVSGGSSGSATAALWVTCKPTVDDTVSAGWRLVDTIAVSGPSNSDSGTWKPLIGVVARRCKIVYTHGGGGSATITGWVVGSVDRNS
jgi:hypothetical protein